MNSVSTRDPVLYPSTIYRVVERDEIKASEDIALSSSTIEKIQKLIPEMLIRKESSEFQVMKKGHTLVFSLKAEPDLVFKMFGYPDGPDLIWGNERIEERYFNMLQSREVCAIHRLALLTIPRAQKFKVELNGREVTVIAEERLDIDPRESVQKKLWTDHVQDLTETVQQLITFISETGYKDVAYRNIPILDISDTVQGSRRIGLIDFEHMSKDRIGILIGLGVYGGGLCFPGLRQCVVSKEHKNMVDKAISSLR